MAASKPFGDEVNSLGSAISLFNITKSDSTDLPSVVRLIYVGTGGDISVVTTTGVTVVHYNTASGTYIGPFFVARVNSTGTTASNLIGYV